MRIVVVVFFIVLVFNELEAVLHGWEGTG